MPTEFTTCQYPECERILGADSRSEAWPFCHEHRTCHKCGVPISAIDARTSAQLFEQNKDEFFPYHSRCVILDNHSRVIESNRIGITSAWVSVLNGVRLECYPNPELSVDTNVQAAEIAIQNQIALMVRPVKSNSVAPSAVPIHEMDVEQVFTVMKMLSAATVQCKLALGRSKESEIQNAIKVRESKATRTAIQERKANEVKAPKTLDKATKSIASRISEMTKLGLSYPDAVKSIHGILIKRGDPADKSYEIILAAMMGLGTPIGDAKEILEKQAIASK